MNLEIAPRKRFGARRQGDVERDLGLAAPIESLILQGEIHRGKMDQPRAARLDGAQADQGEAAAGAVMDMKIGIGPILSCPVLSCRANRDLDQRLVIFRQALFLAPFDQGDTAAVERARQCDQNGREGERVGRFQVFKHEGAFGFIMAPACVPGRFS
jgi:hypothetical protein